MVLCYWIINTTKRSLRPKNINALFLRHQLIKPNAVKLIHFVVILKGVITQYKNFIYKIYENYVISLCKSCIKIKHWGVCCHILNFLTWETKDELFLSNQVPNSVFTCICCTLWPRCQGPTTWCRCPRIRSRACSHVKPKTISNPTLVHTKYCKCITVGCVFF